MAAPDPNRNAETTALAHKFLDAAKGADWRRVAALARPEVAKFSLTLS